MRAARIMMAGMFVGFLGLPNDGLGGEATDSFALQPVEDGEQREAQAQSSRPRWDDEDDNARSGQQITCESRQGRSEYCPTNTVGRVRLERQLSDAPCEEDSTWGADRDGGGVWVSDGCRAVFVVEPRRRERPRKDWEEGGKTVRCESTRERYGYCRTRMHGRVRLLEQLSKTPCREYETWGQDGDGSGIWVSDGCRGIFVVEDRGWGRRRDRDSRTVTCESENYSYNYCRAPVRRDVKLREQLSKTPCYEGDTWGADRGGIWVDRGCGGVFEVE